MVKGVEVEERVWGVDMVENGIFTARIPWKKLIECRKMNIENKRYVRVMTHVLSYLTIIGGVRPLFIQKLNRHAKAL